MDIYSGKKEARINIPMEAETDYSDLSTEQAMVVVDPPAVDEVETDVEERKALRDQQPQKPPAYDAAGKITPPKPDTEGVITDSESFKFAIDTLINADSNAAKSEALFTLLDLSHDIYYGLELMKNAEALQQLLWLMYGVDHWDPVRTATQHKQAASILSSAIQNNPTALQAARKSWRTFMPGPGNNSPEKGDAAMVERMLTLLSSETDPAALRTKIQALSGLVKAPEVRDAFLEQDGMNELLRIYLTKLYHKDNVGEPAWKVVHEKIAQFVSDNFLDADMGAEAGVWPKEGESKTNTEGCYGGVRKFQDACWPIYHDEFITEDRSKEHEEWSGPFKTLLDSAFGLAKEPVVKEKIAEDAQANMIQPEAGSQDRTETREL